MPRIQPLCRSLVLALAPALAAGCAAPRAQVAPDTALDPQLAQDLVLTGRPYAIRLTGAQAGGPAARGPAGRIEGRVCGEEVRLKVEHHGGPVLLDGLVAQEEAEIWIGENAAGRLISGSVGDRSFSLRLTRGGLTGQIGDERFSLRAEQDALTGSAGPLESMALGGWAELWRLPTAVQGALVPLMLACEDARGEQDLAMARVRFGRPPLPPMR